MIQLIGVTKQYLYGAKVLGALDMTIDDGEIVALLGDEQSGKTSFIKVVCGCTECEGKVLIDGKDISCKTDDVITVFDDLAIFENRTTYYNLAFPLIIRGYDKATVDERVKQSAMAMGITACLYEKVKKLPLIDKKRIGIARLFLRDAKVILVDDITCGLDKKEAELLWQEVMPILLKKAKDGVSIIFATTDKDEALSIANRIVVLHYGDVKQVDSADNILQNPSNIWSAQALDCDYHFERANIEQTDEHIVAMLADGDRKIALDISHLKGKFASSYVGKDVYVGWNSNAYLEHGERMEDVAYCYKYNGENICVTSNGERVHGTCVEQKVCTMPQQDKVCLFDVYSENSIMIDN